MNAAEAPVEGIPPPLSSMPPTIDAADAIALNVLSPSGEEVPGGRITFPRIHLDTKVSQLKIRIRNALPAAPAPERQRLIYRGHALLNADATLRQVLRPQTSTEAHSDVYTLHLVLVPGNADSNSPTPMQPAVHASTGGLQEPPTHPLGPNDVPRAPGHQMPAHVLAHAQATQMMLQNQLNLIQQELAGGDHQRQHQHDHGPVHPNAGRQATSMPNGMQITYEVHQGQPGQQMPIMPIPAGFGFGHPNATSLQAFMQQQQQLMQHPALAGHQPMPIAGQIPTYQPGFPAGPNEELAVTTEANDANGPNVSAPTPTTTRVHETIGPQGQRIRTVVRESLNLPVSRHGTPNPASRPASTDPTSQQPRAVSPNPMLPAMPGINLQRPQPALTSAPTQSHFRGDPTRHAPVSFMMPPPMPTVSASPSTTMAWVVSSPTGPEALLFAPGHGLFSSTSQTGSVGLIPTRTSRHRVVAATSQSSVVVAQAAAGPAPPQPGQAPAAQALARLPHPNAAPAAQLAEENEFLNGLVGRGWLFIRLYVITFFISEPNTWRRYILLSLIAFVVFLPRPNFLQRAMAQVRRHIDALIGPPTPPARDAHVVPGQTNADGTAALGATQPVATPAEGAARLLREHEAQNPNVIRDVLFRIERALAMFLASLVPGVGERHIQAREDQRREAERVENERRTREEAERAAALTQAGSSAIGSAEAGSTAVETRDEVGEARERTTQGQAVQASA